MSDRNGPEYAPFPFSDWPLVEEADLRTSSDSFSDSVDADDKKIEDASASSSDVEPSDDTKKA